MASRLFDMFRRKKCAHQFSWPRRRSDGESYQVCLLCGDEYKYDWNAMRRLDRITEARPAHHLLRRQGAAVRGQRLHGNEKLSWRPRARRIKWQGQEILFRALGASAWQRGAVDNISSSGVLFHSSESLPDNSELEMFLEMPAEITGQKNSRVLARGMVVRTDAPAEPGGQVAVAAGIWDYKFVRDKGATH